MTAFMLLRSDLECTTFEKASYSDILRIAATLCQGYRLKGGWLMKKRWLQLVLFLVLTPMVFAEVGEVGYMSGAVELTRDGEIFDEYDLDIGMAVENFDYFQTGEDGEIIINLDTPKSPQSEISISPNTIFTIEIESFEQREKTTLGLFAGAVGLKVKALKGNQDFQVNSETVSMGVRGTDFTVQSSPAGDVLVSCESGSVACYDEDDGREYYAEPGQVVEKRAQELFRQIPVAVSNLDDFKREWIAERISAFKANALKAITYYAKRYVVYFDAFNQEYASLMAKSEILERWAEENQEDRIGSRIQIMRDLKEINENVFNIRVLLFLFERYYFRLLELESYFHQGYGAGQIEPGLTAAAFFTRFNREKRELAEKMARVRFVMKLRDKRSDSVFDIGF
jgi:hypothetical protein